MDHPVKECRFTPFLDTVDFVMGCKQMKTIKIIVLFLFAIFVLPYVCVALEAGETFKSPDGKYTLKLVPDPDENSVIGGLSIANNSTGELFQDSAATPIYSVKWTGDSKTVVLIVHVSGGSEAVVYHLNNKNKWVSCDLEPTIGDVFSVVQLTMRKDTVEFRYKVGKRTTGDSYLYSFVFHPDTLTRTDEKIKEIDEATYKNLDLRVEKESGRKGTGK